MTKILLLAVIVLLTIYSKTSIAQSFEELKTLTGISTINEADNVLSKYGYIYEESKKIKDGTDFTTFHKSSNEKDRDASVGLSKAKNGSYTVQFFTHSTQLFSPLKEQLLNYVGIKFWKETIEGRSYTRYFGGSSYFIGLSIVSPETDKETNLYVLSITYSLDYK